MSVEQSDVGCSSTAQQSHFGHATRAHCTGHFLVLHFVGRIHRIGVSRRHCHVFVAITTTMAVATTASRGHFFNKLTASSLIVSCRKLRPRSRSNHAGRYSFTIHTKQTPHIVTMSQPPTSAHAFIHQRHLVVVGIHSCVLLNATSFSDASSVIVVAMVVKL